MKGKEEEEEEGEESPREGNGIGGGSGRVRRDGSGRNGGVNEILTITRRTE